MFTVTIQAESVEEMRNKLFAIAQQWGFSCDQIVVAERAVNVAAEVIKEHKEKTRRTRKTKETPPKIEESETWVDEGKQLDMFAESSEQQAITPDQALKEVAATMGMNAAREVLAKFSCTRLSELPPEHNESFVKTCQETVLAKASA